MTLELTTEQPEVTAVDEGIYCPSSVTHWPVHECHYGQKIDYSHDGPVASGYICGMSPSEHYGTLSARPRRQLNARKLPELTCTPSGWHHDRVRTIFLSLKPGEFHSSCQLEATSGEDSLSVVCCHCSLPSRSPAASSSFGVAEGEGVLSQAECEGAPG